MSCRFFARQLDWFARHDYHALARDLRGHGALVQGHARAHHSDYAQDVHGFIGDKGLENVTLVGWSMGVFRECGITCASSAPTISRPPS